MTTFSPLLKIELIGAGQQVNAWGDTTNTNLGTLIEQAIAGAVTVTLADSNVTLTQVDGQADQARNAILLIAGTQSQARTVLVPNTSKLYLVRNSTTGGYGVRVQRSGGGEFVEVPNGKTAIVFSDGTDVATAVQYLLNPAIQGGTITGLATPLAVDSGGTGANTADLARINLQAAKSGINSDISGLTGLLTPLSVASGGTGGSNAAAARTNLLAARSGVNNDITQITGLTTALTLAQGGTGAALAASEGAVLYSGAAATAFTAVGTPGFVLRSNGTAAPTWTAQTGAVALVVDGNGAAFSSGLKGFVQVPFAATITSVTLLADQTGSVVLNIWKDTFANFPPTVADSICGSSKPTISSSNKYTDSTLTGWTTSIAANDILAFNVESVLNFTKLTITLNLVRT
jgi:hypothetical protein